MKTDPPFRISIATESCKVNRPCILSKSYKPTLYCCKFYYWNIKKRTSQNEAVPYPLMLSWFLPYTFLLSILTTHTDHTKLYRPGFDWRRGGCNQDCVWVDEGIPGCTSNQRVHGSNLRECCTLLLLFFFEGQDADQPLTCGDERRRERGGVVCEVSGRVTLQSLFNVLFNQLLLCVARKLWVCLPMIDWSLIKFIFLIPFCRCTSLWAYNNFILSKYAIHYDPVSKLLETPVTRRCQASDKAQIWPALKKQVLSSYGPLFMLHFGTSL